MADKPNRASEYSSEQVRVVRSTCLYVATKLGDLLDDVVVVGGLVPSLVIEQSSLPEGASAHVGTSDLDVGLELALLGEGRYRTFTERLRDAGFAPDRTEDGRETRQRWRAPRPGSVTVDFVIAPSQEADQGGKLRHIERDFAATLRPLLRDPDAQRAVEVLRADFLDHDSVGPRRVAEFLHGRPDDEVQADVAGFVRALLDRCASAGR